MYADPALSFRGVNGHNAYNLLHVAIMIPMYFLQHVTYYKLFYFFTHYSLKLFFLPSFCVQQIGTELLIMQHYTVLKFIVLLTSIIWLIMEDRAICP